jgi:DNA-binding XRE family transcriptional regulator
MNHKRNETLIAQRKICNLSQEQVAKAVGISTRSYKYLEAGERDPNVETAISIAELLKSNVPDLFGLRRQPEENTTQANCNTDKKAEPSEESQDGLVVKLLRAVCESKDIPATLTIEALADGVDDAEREVFRKEIREAVAALQEAEAALV